MPGTLPTSATLARATLARATLRGASPFARATLPGTTLPGARANLPGARATLPGPTLLPTATVFTERLGVYEHGDQVAAVVAVWIGLSEVRCSSTQGRLRVTSWERGRPGHAGHRDRSRGSRTRHRRHLGYGDEPPGRVSPVPGPQCVAALNSAGRHFQPRSDFASAQGMFGASSLRLLRSIA